MTFSHRRERRVKTVWACALLALSSAAAAEEPAPQPADEILLQDGSRIVGRIVAMEEGVLQIETQSAGKVAIEFQDVKGLTSATRHDFVLADGSKLVGVPVWDPALGFRVATEVSGVLPVDLGKVAAIDPPPKKAVSQKGSIVLNGRVTDGNTRIKGVGAIGDYEARTDLQRFTLRGDWSYAEERGNLIARNASGAIKYDIFFTKRFFGFTNATFRGDDFADLNLRTTLGAGVGYQFVDRKQLTYYEETGISFFDEDFDNAPDDRYAASRVSGKLDWTVIADRLAFFHFHELFFGFEDQDDVYAETKNGLRLTIVANFFASLQVNYRWDNTPAPGNQRGDTEYLWGIGYSFDF